MKSTTRTWMIVMILGLVGLVVSRVSREYGNVYVEVTENTFYNVGSEGESNWVQSNKDEALDHDLADVVESEIIRFDTVQGATPGAYWAAMQDDPEQDRIVFSFSRTIGIWVAAIFTLFLFSFLYRDNPLYKIAESCVIGVSAAYWMVISFWTVLVPNLFGKLFPGLVQKSVMPGLDGEAELIYLIPLVLGVMLLWRLAPKGGWISRWPMAFIIGVFCGLRLPAFIYADFVRQIEPTIMPLNSLGNIIIVTGVLSCLVYFFFSWEHKGVVGHTARVGIWFLMVTFGAAFGYTVMGRIALLAIRLEFLFDDWLWLIDPKGLRVDPAEVVSMIETARPLLNAVGHS